MALNSDAWVEYEAKCNFCLTPYNKVGLQRSRES